MKNQDNSEKKPKFWHKVKDKASKAWNWVSKFTSSQAFRIFTSVLSIVLVATVFSATAVLAPEIPIILGSLYIGFSIGKSIYDQYVNHKAREEFELVRDIKNFGENVKEKAKAIELSGTQIEGEAPNLKNPLEQKDQHKSPNEIRSVFLVDGIKYVSPWMNLIMSILSLNIAQIILASSSIIMGALGTKTLIEMKNNEYDERVKTLRETHFMKVDLHLTGKTTENLRELRHEMKFLSEYYDKLATDPAPSKQDLEDFSKSYGLYKKPSITQKISTELKKFGYFFSQNFNPYAELNELKKFEDLKVVESCPKVTPAMNSKELGEATTKLQEFQEQTQKREWTKTVRSSQGITPDVNIER